MADFQNLPGQLPHIVRWAIGGLGWAGAGFICYGSISALTGERWLPLERIAEPLSSAITIMGTAITAVSIYFFSSKPTAPVSTSYLGTAVVIAACMVALFILIWWGLPVVVVNGFAITGLAGALYRIQPNPAMLAQRKSKKLPP